MNSYGRVLIADDSNDIRKLLRLTLANNGVQIIEANTGKQALELIERTRPRLALLDIMMPGEMDGLEVCRRIKADPDLRHTVVVLVTSRGQQADILEGRSAGADEYLVKPFSPLQLIDMLRQLLVPRSSHFNNHNISSSRV